MLPRQRGEGPSSSEAMAAGSLRSFLGSGSELQPLVGVQERSPGDPSPFQIFSSGVGGSAPLRRSRAPGRGNEVLVIFVRLGKEFRRAKSIELIDSVRGGIALPHQISESPPKALVKNQHLMKTVHHGFGHVRCGSRPSHKASAHFNPSPPSPSPRNPPVPKHPPYNSPTYFPSSPTDAHP